jgi:hypothetical protein
MLARDAIAVVTELKEISRETSNCFVYPKTAGDKNVWTFL